MHADPSGGTDERSTFQPRPLHSLLRYIGGKSKLADQIVKLIPPHLAYVEPFAGGAWVFFKKPPSKVEVLNDVDGELINFWRVVHNHPDEFLRCCERLLPSREMFEAERSRSTTGMTDIQRATRYYYLQRLAFGGGMKTLNFGTSSIRAPAFHVEGLKASLFAVQKRLQRVLIECLDACDCIEKYDRPSTFFYLDPPYLGGQKYRFPFTEQDFELLAVSLGTLRGKFMMTVNDCDVIRRVFGRFKIESVESSYFIANAKDARNARPRQRQLLVHNLERVEG